MNHNIALRWWHKVLAFLAMLISQCDVSAFSAAVVVEKIVSRTL